MQTLNHVWSVTTSILDVLGYPATILVILTACVKGWQYLRGVIPVGMRLGKGLSKRKIALFGSGDGYTTLREVVLRSSLFSDKNLVGVPNMNEFANREGTDCYIVFYPQWKDNIHEILKVKDDQVPLLVYCPADADRIDADVMRQIDLHRNTAVSNFRGRLLNDLFTAMITTNYEK
ncbi:MAG: hypothetical protein WBC19_15540 [Pyrinomonadaceae bacterium]